MLLIRVDHVNRDHDHAHNQTGSYQGGALVNVEQIKSIHGRTQNGKFKYNVITFINGDYLLVHDDLDTLESKIHEVIQASKHPSIQASDLNIRCRCRDDRSYVPNGTRTSREVEPQATSFRSSASDE